MEAADRQLMSLINAAQALTSTLDLNEVLDRLIGEVLGVIRGADAGILFLYEEKQNILRPKSAVGFDINFMKNITLKPDEGMSGKTFRRKRGQIFTHEEQTSSGMSNISSKNQTLYQKSLGASNAPVSTICAPLNYKEGHIGVLTIDSFSKDIYFNEQDLMILETFAAQASIAIQNAELFTQNVRTKQLHQTLSEVSFSRGGLNDMTHALSELLKHEVCLINEFYECIGASSDGAKARFQSLKVELGELFSHIRDSGNNRISEQIDQDGSVFWVSLFPIRAENTIVGFLCLWASSGLDPLDEFAIEQANHIFALEMLALDRELSTHFQRDAMILERMIEAKPIDPVLTHRLLDIAGNRGSFSCAHLSIEPKGLTFEKYSERQQQISRTIYHELKKIPERVIVLDRRTHFTFLFLLENHQGEEALTSFFNGLFDSIKTLSSFRFYVGVGRLFKNLETGERSYQDAVQCIDYMKRHHPSERLLSFSKMGFHRLFTNHEKEELLDFIYEQIGPILKYDADHQTVLFETLMTYFDSKLNTSLTSKKMYVHLNTIKYRLRMIRSLLGENALEGRGFFDVQLAANLFQDHFSLADLNKWL